MLGAWYRMCEILFGSVFILSRFTNYYQLCVWKSYLHCAYHETWSICWPIEQQFCQTAYLTCQTLPGLPRADNILNHYMPSCSRAWLKRGLEIDSLTIGTQERAKYCKRMLMHKEPEETSAYCILYKRS